MIKKAINKIPWVYTTNGACARQIGAANSLDNETIFARVLHRNTYISNCWSQHLSHLLAPYVRIIIIVKVRAREPQVTLSIETRCLLKVQSGRNVLSLAELYVQRELRNNTWHGWLSRGRAFKWLRGICSSVAQPRSLSSRHNIVWIDKWR